MELSSAPVINIPFRDSVLAVEFSPYEWSKALLAVALPSSLAVYSILFKEESEDEKQCVDKVWEAHIDNGAVALAWSPSSSLRSSPRCLQLLVATEDHKVLQFTSNLYDKDVVNEECSHSEHINSVTYSGDTGEFAASTGDDLVARVWKPESSKVVAKFLLTSPGVCVKFSPDDADVLLVAEMGGTLRMYSISGGCATLSLHSPTPLLSMDWTESGIVAAAGPKCISVWSLTSLQPLRESVQTSSNLVTDVKLCKSTEGLVASVSHPHTLKVSHLQANRIPMVINLKVISGISWHLQVPYLAVASDRKLLIWKADCV